MKNENTKYWIIGIIALSVAAWYFWDKVKEVAAATAEKVSSQATPAPAPATIAANTTAGAVRDNYYTYGSGKIYFEDRDPSTYKTPELLSFTPNMATRSAFKSLN